ncbi:RolB family protein [Rhizobium rhizogenes]|uniref:RolB family protein n=1 Tax=Rhizobium rhizogenes TaxID=359 RepID=UPI00235586E9|nr:RolB family protein [Rhizobium rhizogenes]
MAPRLHFLPRFQPRDLTKAWSQINLFEEIQCAFITYSHIYSKTLMDFQKRWAQGVLELEDNPPPVNILKQLAQLLKNKICYHPPMLVDHPDLARERDQRVFVYLSREKMREVLKEKSITFGLEAVLATTIQPYRSELAVQEMVRAHNLAWPHRRMEEPDLECFIAIFASTLFIHLLELKVTNLYGREVACTFFVRQGTGNRCYDVVACGTTQFSENARVIPRPAAPSPEPDLTLRLSVPSEEGEEGVMKTAAVNLKKEA